MVRKKQLSTEERLMGNSPTDKSQDFIKSGMTLITQVSSDKHLKKINNKASQSLNGNESTEERGNQEKG